MGSISVSVPGGIGSKSGIGLVWLFSGWRIRFQDHSGYSVPSGCRTEVPASLLAQLELLSAAVELSCSLAPSLQPSRKASGGASGPPQASSLWLFLQSRLSCLLPERVLYFKASCD